jgi:hypothetical protein
MKKNRSFEVITRCLDKNNDTIAALKYFGHDAEQFDCLLLRIFSVESIAENGTLIQPTCLTLEGQQVVALYDFLEQFFRSAAANNDMEADGS